MINMGHSSLPAKDEELPAAERVHEEEATAWSKEERRCLETRP